jgi:hypothetical protein
MLPLQRALMIFLASVLAAAAPVALSAAYMGPDDAHAIAQQEPEGGCCADRTGPGAACTMAGMYCAPVAVPAAAWLHIVATGAQALPQSRPLVRSDPSRAPDTAPPKLFRV